MLGNRIRDMIAHALAAFALILPISSALAGSQTGSVIYVGVDRFTNAGVLTVEITPDAIVAKPACASATDRRWVIDLATNKAVDQYMYATLISAMGAGWKVYIVGMGTCSAIPYLEDIRFIEVRK